MKLKTKPFVGGIFGEASMLLFLGLTSQTRQCVTFLCLGGKVWAGKGVAGCWGRLEKGKDIFVVAP